MAFIEAPSRAHRQLGDPLLQTRVPGKLNISTLRYPHALAALLDVPELALPIDESAGRYGLQSLLVPKTDNPIYAFVPGASSPYGKANGRRDLWADYLVSRDGFDRLTRLPLPGVPASPHVFTPAAVGAIPAASAPMRISGSRPFRDPSFDYSAAPNGSVEHTLMRGQLATNITGPADVYDKDAEQERLFELDQVADPLVRNRLLSKIANNVTTRSHVFIVFMTVRFHEVYEDTTNFALRIGGRYDLNHNGNPDDDTHRGFFILDRSDAENAYNPATHTFNWKEIVKYRLTIN